ncbi:MAG: hypothetical protein AAFR49_12840, partial [Pseudomonadota bacterium]
MRIDVPFCPLIRGTKGARPQFTALKLTVILVKIHRSFGAHVVIVCATIKREITARKESEKGRRAENAMFREG